MTSSSFLASEFLPWTILLVERCPVKSAKIRKALTDLRMGFMVSRAGSLAEAKDLLTKQVADAILVDFGLWSKFHARCEARAPTEQCLVIALLDEYDVVGFRDAIDSGVAGFYYKDQVDHSLGRRILTLLMHRLAVASPIAAQPAFARPLLVY